MGGKILWVKYIRKNCILYRSAYIGKPLYGIGVLRVHKKDPHRSFHCSIKTDPRTSPVHSEFLHSNYAAEFCTFVGNLKLGTKYEAWNIGLAVSGTHSKQFCSSQTLFLHSLQHYLFGIKKIPVLGWLEFRFLPPTLCTS